MRNLTTRRWSTFAVGLFVALAGTQAAAQNVPIGGGVAIDADGVLSIRRVDDAAERARPKHSVARKGRKPDREIERMAYVSLPRLFAEARNRIERRQPLTDEMRLLHGMVRLRYVFVYPEERDLVIAGDAEEWEDVDPARPRGKSSGRPVLRLDDLVVALRIAGPGSRERVFGCSLDLTQEALDQVVATAGQLGAVPRGQFDAAAERVIAAAGPQQVRFFGLPADTPFAFVFVEADYLLKRLALGVGPAPRGFRSHLEMMRSGEGLYNRWWFTPNYEPLAVSGDGLSYEIRGHGLKVETSSALQSNAAPASASAARFAAQFERDFDELGRQCVPFADLWNLTDLTILAALIQRDKLAEKTGWKLDGILDPDGYPVPRTPTPRQAEPLGNYRVSGRAITFAVGGVEINPRAVVASERRAVDASDRLPQLARQFDHTQWFLVRERSADQ